MSAHYSVSYASMLLYAFTMLEITLPEFTIETYSVKNVTLFK